MTGHGQQGIADGARAMEPGGRASAPPPLTIVQAFINTNDREGNTDALGSPTQLAVWLKEHQDMPVAAITQAEWQHMIALREALRALARANMGHSLEAEALVTLRQMAQQVALQVQFDERGTSTLIPTSAGILTFAGVLLIALQRAQADGTWKRLKACQRDICQWVFYDHSKNNASTWCSMAICGSRVKMRAYRQRHLRRSEDTPGVGEKS